MLIALEGIRFYAYHGYYPQEQTVGAWFEADVYLHLHQAPTTDQLPQTVNYEQVISICQQYTQPHQAVQLIETLAQQIAHAVHALSPNIASVKVRLCKPNAPVLGLVKKIYVEVEKK